MPALIDAFTQQNRRIAKDDIAEGRLQSSILKAIPRVKAIVIGCADMRADPTHVFALEPGESVVLRNIGGRVTPGLLAQLGMLGRMAELIGITPGGGAEFNLIVMQHTDCGLSQLAAETAMLEKYFEVEGEALIEKNVNDPRAAVACDVALLKSTPGLPPSWIVTGLVYDVSTGLVETVAAPKLLGSYRLLPPYPTKEQSFMTSSQIKDPAVFPHAFDDALNNGDIERLLALYEPRATFRASDGSLQQGTEALQKEMQSLMAVKANLHNELRHVMQSEDTALIIVDRTLSLTIPEAGKVERKGTATNVLRHTEENGWRMLIANPQGIEDLQ